VLKGLTCAIRTLSVLPAFGDEPDNIADSLPWFPLTGAILGFLCMCTGWLSSFLFPNWAEATAVVMLVYSVLVTRGFHLDGLADCADGFGAGWTPERRLEIMKDSHLGAFGVIALVLMLLIKWVALTKLVETGNIQFILIAYIISRTTSAELSTCLPYARKEGGTAGPCVTGSSPRHRFLALGSASLLCSLVNGLGGLLLLALGLAVSRLLGVWFTKRVGGITGDLLGTNSEVVEATIMLAAASGIVSSGGGIL